MTISSTIGYRLPLVDRLLPKIPAERRDWLKPQSSSSPASTTSSQAAVSSRTGGLLSSINISEVLKLTDTPPIDFSALQKPLGTREFLGEAIKRSEAVYKSGGDAAAGSLTELYTQKDVDIIRAATGYNLVVMNNLTTVVDDNGNPPLDSVGMQAMNMAGSIEMARLSGGLADEMTPEYLKDMFSAFSRADTPLPSDWLVKALDYLGSTEGSRKSIQP